MSLPSRCVPFYSSDKLCVEKIQAFPHFHKSSTHKTSPAGSLTRPTRSVIPQASTDFLTRLTSSALTSSELGRVLSSFFLCAQSNWFVSITRVGPVSFSSVFFFFLFPTAISPVALINTRKGGQARQCWLFLLRYGSKCVRNSFSSYQIHFLEILPLRSPDFLIFMSQARIFLTDQKVAGNLEPPWTTLVHFINIGPVVSSFYITWVLYTHICIYTYISYNYSTSFQQELRLPCQYFFVMS